MARKVFFVAAETSGDLLSAEIVDALLAVQPNVEIEGIGGEYLRERGIQSPIDVSELAIVGFLEGIKIYKRVVELADAAADAIIEARPDTVALVDSWGFTLRVAQRVRKLAPDIRLVKVVGPQVWATRPGRARTLAATVDHLVCIHAMEAPYYEPFGLPVTVMGNPALSRGHRGDRQAGREALGLDEHAPVLLVLPGSRKGEIDAVAPKLLEAARTVKRNRPEVEIVVHPASSVRSYLLGNHTDLDTWTTVTPDQADRFDVMACADFAVACSGTVTSELAQQETPFLVGYHTGWVTWALARFFLFKPTHITLLNIAAGDREIAPEFVQTKFRADAMAAKALELLGNKQVRQKQIEAQKKALSLMGEGRLESAQIAAKVILGRR